METKFTKGEWKIAGYGGEHDETGARIKCDDLNICTTHHVRGSNWSEYYANAKLIADAGTTANKCGLLPSELLDQRNDLLEALIELYDSLPDGYTSKCLPKVRTAIKKATE